MWLLKRTRMAARGEMAPAEYDGNLDQFLRDRAVATAVGTEGRGGGGVGGEGGGGKGRGDGIADPFPVTSTGVTTLMVLCQQGNPKSLVVVCARALL